MTRLAWGTPGTRLFDTGIDQGVLYLDNRPGVPWNGLKSIAEQSDGGAPRPYYVDGYKYLNLATSEEFTATISAFGCPREFLECDGTRQLQNGLFATQQVRRPFGLSYRTLVGNDRRGDSYGYKIHLVYNALAAPTTRNNQSAAKALTPTDLSWAITTQPPRFGDIRPTAHFVIDSTMTPPALLAVIEDILYGSEGSDARLPTVEELVTIFADPGPIVARNLAINPDGIGLTGFGSTPAQATMTNVDGWTRYTIATTGAVGLHFAMGVPFVPGVTYRQLFEARANKPLTVRQRILQSTVGPIVTITPDAEFFDGLIVAGTGSATASGLVMHSSGTPWAVGDYIEVRRVLYSDPAYTGPHFSGSTPDTDVSTYDWEGDVDNSTSVLRSWY